MKLLKCFSESLLVSLYEEIDIHPFAAESLKRRWFWSVCRGQLLLFTLDAERQTTYPVVEDVRRCFRFFSRSQFSFQGIWMDMIYNCIDHLNHLYSFLISPYSNTQVKRYIMTRFPMLGRMSFNPLQGSPTKSANVHEFSIWDNYMAIRMRVKNLLMSGIPSMRMAGSESVQWSQSMMLAPTWCWKNMLKTTFWRAYERGIAGYWYSPPATWLCCLCHKS